MKEISCRTCGEIFNPDLEPMMCPHNLFPQKCKKHNRFHCGNLECNKGTQVFHLVSNRKKENAK